MFGRHDFTNFQSSKVTVTGDGLFLPDEAASFVKISNWTVDDNDGLTVTNLNNFAGDNITVDRSSVVERHIFYGYGLAAHPLYYADSTEWLPVRNLNQIFLRARKGSDVPVYFSWVG